MRIIKFLAFAFLLIFAGYSGLWYMNGKANLRQMEKGLTTLSGKTWVKELKYDSLKLKGYPFRIQIVMDKPSITLDTNKIFALMKVPMKSAGMGDVEYSTEGTLNVNTNVFGSHYRLVCDGALDSLMRFKSKQYHFKDTSKKMYVDFRVDLMKALKNQNLEQLYALDEVYPFSGLHLVSKKGQSVNVDTNDILLSYDLADMDLSFKRDDVDGSFYLDMRAEDLVVTKKYSEFLDEMDAELGVSKKSNNLDKLGKIDFHMALTYNGPTTKDALENLEELYNPLQASLKIETSNDLYELDHQGSVNLELEGGELKALAIDGKGTTQCKPELHRMMVETYRILLSVYEDKLSKDPSSQKNTKVYAFLDKHLEDIVPALHELGLIKTSFVLNLEKKGSKVAVDLKDASFDTELYALHSKGALKGNMLMPVPTGELTLSFEKFDVWFDRLATYWSLAGKYYDVAQEPKPFYLEKGFDAKLKHFMRALAEEVDPKSENLTIRMEFPGKDPFVNIGKKTPEELQKAFEELMMPEKQE